MRPTFVDTAIKSNFNPVLINVIKSLKLIEPTQIQSYTWPSIMRLINTFIISGPRSGKTMSYVLPLMSFLLEKNDRLNYAQCEREKGPIAVIICPTAVEAENIQEKFRLMHCNKLDVRTVLIIPPFGKKCLVRRNNCINIIIL